MSELKTCPYLTSVHEYDGDPEKKCGLIPGLYCWGPDASHCPLKGEKMSELKPCEAIEILESIYPSKKQIVTGEYPDVAEALDMAIVTLRRAQSNEPPKSYDDVKICF